ncbi:MAG TPA: hypothetical protein VES66_10585 [Terriglobales bacterium]|nr:hypothetical protein [Terriglobales bacterium]
MPQTSQPRRSAPILASLLLLAAAAAAQEPGCAELQALKKETYGFRPTKLTQQQQTAKEKQIDRFWKLAGTQGKRGVACLRGMLKSESADSFFLFDGASLLLHLDDSQPSLAVVSNAAGRSDLGVINAAGYVELVLELAQRGVDTGALADKYIKYPKVDGYIAEHSLPVDRATGAIFLYASMPADRADKLLVPLLGAKEAYIRDTATLQLALNMTQESYRALAGLAGIGSLPEYARKQVIAALAYHAPEGKAIPTYSREQVLARLRALPRTPDQMEAELRKEKPVVGIADDEPFIRSAIAVLSDADLGTVREARRAALLSVSDESLHEYVAYTRIILGVINRLDMYKEYRVH